MADQGRRTALRAFVFRHRGTLLAVPAVALVALGKPTRRSLRRGLAIAVAGELLRCWAVGFSGSATRGGRVGAQSLATGGPYAHTRNPLYLGNLMTAAGFSVVFTGGLRRRSGLALAAFGLGAMLAVYATIVPHEEAFLSERFGDTYADYAVRVPRVGWRIKPAQFTGGAYDASVILDAESRTLLTFGAMVAVALKRTIR